MARNNTNNSGGPYDDYPNVDPAQAFLAPLREFTGFANARAGIEGDLVRAYELLVHHYREK